MRGFVLLCICAAFMRVDAYAATTSLELRFSPTDVTMNACHGYDAPELAGCSCRTQDVGKPDLPVRIIRVVLPADASVTSVTCDPSLPSDLPGRYLVLPKQPQYPLRFGSGYPGADIPPPEFVGPDPATYNSDSEYPAPSQIDGISVSDSFGYRIVQFKVYPLVYIGARQCVRLYTQLNVTVGYDGGANETVRPLCRSSLAHDRVSRWIESMVDNPSDVDALYAAPAIGQTVDYLVVTRADLAAGFQRLADWKATKGLTAKVVTLDAIDSAYEGVDRAMRIRKCIEDYVHNRGTAYVLLGGDVDVVPARTAMDSYYGGSRAPTDLYFAGLDSSWNDDGDAEFGESGEYDLAPDVFLGRAPVDSITECSQFVDKVIAYESSTDPAFGGSALLLAGQMMCGWCDFPPRLQWIHDTYLDPAGYDTKRVFDCQSCTANNDKCLNHDTALFGLKLGYNLICHADHADFYAIGSSARCLHQKLIRKDCNVLPPWENHPRSGVLITLGCEAGAFDYECWSEAFVRASGGAAAVISNVREGIWDQISQEEEFFRYVTSATGTAGCRLGEAFVCAQMAGDEYTKRNLNLLGDPEMTLQTAQQDNPPEPVILTHEYHILDDDLTPPSYGNGNGKPELGETVEVVVTLKNSGTQTATNVSAQLSVMDSGSVTVVQANSAYGDIAPGATAQSHTAYVFHVDKVPRDTLEVTFRLVITSDQGTTSDTFTELLYPSPVEHESNTIDDDNVPPSQGNGDGQVDSGETIEMSVVLKNVSQGTLTNVTGQLVCATPGVTIIDDTAEWGTIAASESKQSLDAFVYRVYPSVQDKLQLEFHVKVTAAEGWWQVNFGEQVHAPDLLCKAVLVDDDNNPPSQGNNNAVVERLETIELPMRLENVGSKPAFGVTATIAAANSHIVVQQDFESFGAEIAAGSSVWNDPSSVFVFSTTGDYQVSDEVELTIRDSLDRTWVHNIRFLPPAPPSLLRLTPGQMRMDIAWDPATGADYYNIYRRTDLAPPVRINRYPIRGATRYEDIGLEAGVRYYYTIRSVNSHGWESEPSPEACEATNPPLHPGWPVRIDGWDGISSSPTVADLNGDGFKEIVVADDNDKVYVWSHDGTLLPGWPKELPSAPATSAAVADLDGDGALEIVYNGAMVYAWRLDGTDLPGWPKSAGRPAPSSATIADLDCSGSPEVIVGRGDGHVYAWHADGVPLEGWPVEVADQEVRGTPVVADLDLDGSPEVVILTRGDDWKTSILYAFHSDGTIVEGGPGQWSGWPQQITGITFGTPVAGDIDGDLLPEVMVGTFPYYDEENQLQVPGYLYAFNGDGSRQEGSWPQQCASGIWGLSCADVNGDGLPEVVVNGLDGQLRVYRGNGSTLSDWNLQIGPEPSCQPVVADLGNDPGPEVLECPNGIGGMRILRPEGHLLGTPWVMQGGTDGTPAVTDVDNDGLAEVVIGSEDGRVYVWDLTCSADQSAMSWTMFAHDVRHTGYAGPSACQPTHVPTIEFAKRFKDGVWLSLDGKKVTAGTGDFAEFYYIEEADRSCGIRVQPPDPSVYVLSRGSLVDVQGTMSTLAGERVLTNAVITPVADSQPLDPLGVNNLSLGGGDLGLWTRGVTGGFGLNNIGLLVKSWGRVVEIAPDNSYFVVDDGGVRWADGSVGGIKVLLTGLAPGNIIVPPQVMSCVSVTGLSSCETSGQRTIRVLRPRNSSDIVLSTVQ